LLAGGLHRAPFPFNVDSTGLRNEAMSSIVSGLRFSAFTNSRDSRLDALDRLTELAHADATHAHLEDDDGNRLTLVTDSVTGM
jgi:hypothetical protein